MVTFDQLPHDAQLVVLHELAQTATCHYALPADVTTRLINLSENATYAVESPSSDLRFALRVHRAGYHGIPAIQSELNWLINLRETGVVVTPRPLAGRDGTLVQQVAHPRLPAPRNVVLFDWETGAEPGIDDDLEAPFETLGEVTARMHAHVRRWPRPANFTRFTWDFDTSLGETNPHWGRWRDGIGMDGAKGSGILGTADG